MLMLVLRALHLLIFATLRVFSVSSCKDESEWQDALQLLDDMYRSTIEVDRISHSACLT